MNNVKRRCNNYDYVFYSSSDTNNILKNRKQIEVKKDNFNIADDIVPRAKEVPKV